MIRALAATLAVALALIAPGARAEITVVPVTSPGGIEVWLYQDDTIPMLTIDASFLGGGSLDAAGREGTTYAMALLLDEGAGDLDSAAFNTAREDLAARFGFSTDDDGVHFAATMLNDRRDATVELLRLALTEPRFDPEPVARIRAQMLAGARMAAADPSASAGRAFYAAAFPGHPYGRPVEGSVELISTLTVRDLRAAHAAALSRDHLRIAAVGDIGPAELGPLIDRLFGGLPARGAALPPAAVAQLPGTTTVLDFETPVSVVLFGDAGMPTDDPDYLPAMAMDYILGGDGTSSRLAAEMRVKGGLTYGVNTWLADGLFGSLYLGSFSSSNEDAVQGIREVRAEWARLADGGVGDAELAAAKRYLTGAFALRFDGNEQIAASLVGLQLARKDPGYINRRNALVEAVTADDVARVARRLLRPDRLTVVVAGHPEGLEPAAGKP